MWMKCYATDLLSPMSSESDLNVVASGIGVGAGTMSRRDKRFSLLLRQFGKRDVKSDGKGKSFAVSGIVGADADLGLHDDGSGSEFLLVGEILNCSSEAGSVASTKKLLGIGSSALTAHLRRESQRDVEQTVRAGGVAGARSDGSGFSGVKNLHA